MKKKAISLLAVTGGFLCLLDCFMDLGLSGNSLDRNLSGVLGIVFIVYGIILWTRYENIANGLLGIILGGVCILEFFRTPQTGHPFRFVHLIGGICILLIGIIYLLPASDKKKE